MAIMNEKPVARGMDVPPGRTVPDESPGAVLNAESVPVEPEVDDKLKTPTTEEEGVIDMALGAIKDLLDRAGLKPVERIETTTVEQMSDEEIRKEIDALTRH